VHCGKGCSKSNRKLKIYRHYRDTIAAGKAISMIVPDRRHRSIERDL
jgi:hypothetical protein